MKLTLLPSDKGDCMLLESPDGTTILVDGGMNNSYVSHVRPFLAKWSKKSGRPLDLVYLSHIDQDHIAGILQLMNDIADWRVYHHKVKSGEPWDEPDFPEPPGVARLWHNSFHDQIGKNAGAIGSMLAARAAQLANSADTNLQHLGAAYQAIAASIPEAIKLSSRVSAKQLKIPVNGEFDALLAMVRDPPDAIQLNGPNSPVIKLLGPFEENLKELRTKWNEWLRNADNKKNLARTRDWRDEEDARLDFSALLAENIDDQLGDRGEVTEENLASLMLMVEHDSKRLLLTGDGHYDEILEGLRHNGVIQNGGGVHVNVLKVQHHGSEHNTNRDFARRITADHYVICGNGRHENPDRRVLQVLAESRMGGQDVVSQNPEASRACHFWFNCSVKFLERQIEQRRKDKLGLTEYTKALKHFKEVESDMKDYAARSDARIKLHFLDNKPLELKLV